jgi:hypothetical protein
MERDGYLELMARLATRPQLEHTDPYFTKLNKLRLYYLQNEGKIIAWDRKYPFYMYDKDPVDWMAGDNLTTIEQYAWMVIEAKGRMPLYPQYPVGRFVIDFANPNRKIGVELDGRDFHDRDRDTERDQILKRLGYTIVRITGSEMNRSNFKDWSDWDNGLHEDENLENIEDWIMNTGDGVLEAVKVFKFNGSLRSHKPHHAWFVDLCHRSIGKHRLVDW